MYGIDGFYLEGDFIKKIAIILALAAVIGMCAGCSRDIAPVDTPFAIYCKSEDIVLKLGDKIEDIAPLLGPIARMEVEFAEYDYTRVDYHATEGVFLDYKPDGSVFALRFENRDWQLANGLTIGSKTEDVKAAYPDTEFFKYEETDDLWIAYNEKGDIIEFSEEAPRIIRFKIRSGEVNMIVVKDNTLGVGIF